MFVLGERAEDKRFDGPRQVSGQHFQFVYPVTDVDEGKFCIGPEDMNDTASLLFGEISPEGVTKMFGESRLKVKLFIHFVFVSRYYIYTHIHIYTYTGQRESARGRPRNGVWQARSSSMGRIPQSQARDGDRVSKAQVFSIVQNKTS